MRKLNIVSFIIILMSTIYFNIDSNASDYRSPQCILDMSCVETENEFICCSFCSDSGQIRSCATHEL